MTDVLYKMTSNPINNLLIVGNFNSETGYAWKTISEYFYALGELFISSGNHCYVCYPKVKEVPEALRGSDITIEEFDFFKNSFTSLFFLIRNRNITVLYLTDRPAFSPRYIICRLAGVKKIVIHDRTSGHRDSPGRIRSLAKKALQKYSFFSVDLAIGISDFVLRRLVGNNCIPVDRVVRVYNGVDVNKFMPSYDDYVFKKYGITPSKKVIFASSRANKYKGIQTLIEAADIIVNEHRVEDVAFLFCGDGPDIKHFRSMVSEKNLSKHFQCPGSSGDVQRILRGIDIAVVPSVWQEGFGLSIIEGMATGKPVVATRVGGIVEIIEDGKDGILFDPEDSKGLAEILLDLLRNERLRGEIGCAARNSAVEKWNIEDRKKDLVKVFRERVLDMIGQRCQLY